LGSGPNRIGQGIEFDYACVHAVWAIREEGYDAVMINSNPETVSTDYDTADRLYFEPITRENVWAILERENPLGVFVGFGGQTPLKLAKALAKSKWKILGTPYEAIDIAEDRKRFARLLAELGIPQPPGGTAITFSRAIKTAASLGYPVLARPSYVLGGQAMKLAYSSRELADYLQTTLEVTPDRPVLIDKFLEDAIELDLDLVSDGREVFIGGIMEHIEEAGIHSGDSIAVLPPFSVSDSTLKKVEDYAMKIARALKVVGLLNIQFAVKDDTVYVLEANPRSSRTVPFVSKAIGVPLAKIATKVGLGRRLKEFDLPASYHKPHFAVKFPVFPFSRFPGAEVSFGPQMKSTGEVMGLDADLGLAFLKGQLNLAGGLPGKGQIFISVRNRDKRASVFLAKHLVELGFTLCATSGTAKVLSASSIPVQPVKKVSEGRPHIVDSIKAGEIAWVINTPEGEISQKDSQAIRRAAVEHGVTLITTLAGAQAAVNAVQSLKRGKLEVRSLQEYFPAQPVEVLAPV
jgi:carbamoyl-phosphate synthase large subunit